tara:strand:+ start:975 stop:1109 length:135 start_codon:yes stop_codon:yes gene_type:complete
VNLIFKKILKTSTKKFGYPGDLSYIYGVNNEYLQSKNKNKSYGI